MIKFSEWLKAGSPKYPIAESNMPPKRGKITVKKLLENLNMPTAKVRAKEKSTNGTDKTAEVHLVGADEAEKSEKKLIRAKRFGMLRNGISDCMSKHH